MKSISDKMDSPDRYWEVDVVRGVAIILMLIYHSSFDLYHFGGSLIGIRFNLEGIVKSHLPDLIGTLFFLLVGVSAWLRVQKNPSSSYYSAFIKRGLQVLGCAAVISFTSVFFFPEAVVYFGVLHCIGISLFIIPFCVNFEYLNLLLGVALILIGALIQTIPVSSYWFLWIGLIPKDAVFGDYYPLLPWFGIAMIGIFLGKIYFVTPRVAEWKAHWKQFVMFRVLGRMGRHSLSIYLLHQPVIMGSFYIIGKLRHWILG